MLGLEFDALRFQGAVIDPGIDVEFGQPRVDVFGPGLTPVGEQLGLVPLAHFGAEALVGDLPQSQHHMRVGFGEPKQQRDYAARTVRLC